MSNIRRLPAVTGWLSLLALCCAGGGSLAAGQTAPAPDGLVRQTSRNVDEFYLRPGANFARYKRVMLAPVDVAFATDWQKQHTEISADDALRIRKDMAALVRDEFARQLQSRGFNGKATGYPIVSNAGADVLDVRASVVDLDITAPDDGNPLRHVYVFSAGRGRLIAELRDSQTGELLAKVVDSREARDYPDFQVANRVTNSSEARQIVGLWSRLLRRYLDAAQTETQQSNPKP